MLAFSVLGMLLGAPLLDIASRTSSNELSALPLFEEDNATVPSISLCEEDDEAIVLSIADGSLLELDKGESSVPEIVEEPFGAIFGDLSSVVPDESREGSSFDNNFLEQ